MEEVPGCIYLGTKYGDGTCMSPVISRGKEPFICGLHIAGDDKLGLSMGITRNKLEHIYQEIVRIYQLPSLPIKEGQPPKVKMGKVVINSETVHPNAVMVNQLGPDAEVSIYGSSPLRTSMRSSVHKSPISDHVEEVFGQPNKWGPPQLQPNWVGFNATLGKLVYPTKPFLQSELKRAKEDFLRPLLEKAQKFERAKPLTLDQAINGVDGVRFIDAMNFSTSVGHPLYRAKKVHLDRTMVDGKVKYELPQVWQEEYDAALRAWSEGETANLFVSSTLKDEPTEIGSTKVRVFQACPLVLVLAIRQYFAPVKRFMNLHPREAESAVGINAFSKQWEYLMKYCHTHSSEKVLAWDYSKYDTRMRAQLTITAWGIYIDLARALGYDEESLKIMSKMVWDIVHPLMDYNGTVMRMRNSNISGHPLTVEINDVVNSLYVRMAFFSVCPQLDFRSNVSPLTYGDDLVASRSKLAAKFDYFAAKEFFAKHDIGITPPDKGSIEQSTEDAGSADFLKRVSVYIPEIDTTIGALSFTSLLKSLHSNLKSKNATPEEVAASCLDTAAHESFAWGRSFYDDVTPKLQQVARMANISAPGTFRTFDERVEAWKSKYEATEDTCPI
jgi:hypothetical protein